MEEKWKRMLFYICALLFIMVVYIGMIEQKTKNRLLSASREAADMSEALQAQGEETEEDKTQEDTAQGQTDMTEIKEASVNAGEKDGSEGAEKQTGQKKQDEEKQQTETKVQDETEIQKQTEGPVTNTEPDASGETESSENGKAKPAEEDQDEKKEPDPAAKTGQDTESQKEDAVYALTGGLKIEDCGENPSIRVLICSDNYSYDYHSAVSIGCTSDFVLEYSGKKEEHSTSEVLDLSPESECLADGLLTITPVKEEGKIILPNLARAVQYPSYYGKMEVRVQDGALLVINELPLETYLCGVVPSEMPASYPLEALKAQAVCARTYALKSMSSGRAAEYHADVDDSVSYQVYNNNGPDKRSTEAVDGTRGMVLKNRDGTLVDALYYSTSCGRTMQDDLSEEAVFCAFMDTGGTKAYEASETWYRWQAFFSMEEITRLAGLWQEGFGQVYEMSIAERLKNGSALRLTVSGEGGSFEVEGEYSIRQFLSPLYTPVIAQDGYEADGMSLLPSAFFYLVPEYEGSALTGYSLKGGGYGHGIGLSQNGAKGMADAGLDYTEILGEYYGETLEY